MLSVFGVTGACIHSNHASLVHRFSEYLREKEKQGHFEARTEQKWRCSRQPTTRY